MAWRQTLIGAVFAAAAAASCGNGDEDANAVVPDASSAASTPTTRGTHAKGTRISALQLCTLRIGETTEEEAFYLLGGPTETPQVNGHDGLAFVYEYSDPELDTRESVTLLFKREPQEFGSKYRLSGISTTYQLGKGRTVTALSCPQSGDAGIR